MNDKLIKILQSGNFSLHYHDECVCSIYKGKGKYGKFGGEPEDALIEFDCESEGFAPGEVMLLVQALGGVYDSV